MKRREAIFRENLRSDLFIRDGNNVDFDPPPGEIPDDFLDPPLDRSALHRRDRQGLKADHADFHKLIPYFIAYRRNVLLIRICGTKFFLNRYLSEYTCSTFL